MTNHKKVISLSGVNSSAWTFLDFGYMNGGMPIRDWYENEISDRARFSFDSLIKLNQNTANHVNWVGVDKQMRGILRGQQIWQWRIPGEVQYRVLGAFKGQKRAVFLMGYYHKGDNYTPPDALRTTLDRKKLLDKGECKLYERQAKTDQ